MRQTNPTWQHISYDRVLTNIKEIPGKTVKAIRLSGSSTYMSFQDGFVIGYNYDRYSSDGDKYEYMKFDQIPKWLGVELGIYPKELLQQEVEEYELYQSIEKEARKAKDEKEKMKNKVKELKSDDNFNSFVDAMTQEGEMELIIKLLRAKLKIEDKNNE